MKFNLPFLLVATLGFCSFPTFAYMGPGAGLTAFACLMALLAGIWYVLKGFFWLPLKRRFTGKSADKSASKSEDKNADISEQPDATAATIDASVDSHSKVANDQQTNVTDKTT